MSLEQTPEAADVRRADARLVELLQGRDEATFSSLVHTWSPVMLRVAGYHVSSRASAEEVVQEAWIAVIKGIDGFEGRSSLRTWTLRICANIAKRHGVRESRVHPSGLPEQRSGSTLGPGHFRSAGQEWAGHWSESGEPREWGPESRVVSTEARGLIRDALNRLPLRQAHVVALRDIHGLESVEVAALLETSMGNVRVLLHRGRAALRRELEDYYVGDGARR